MPTILCGSRTSRAPAGSSLMCWCAARLEALVSRALFYDLVARGTVEGDWFGVWSSGIILADEAGARHRHRCSMSDFRFDIAEFVERARTRLLATAPATFCAQRRRSQSRMRAPFPMTASHARAAVLVPIVAREPELTVLMIRRNDTLRSHAGQIAFPGGKIEESDEGPVDAALREAEEETGLPRVLVDAARLSRRLSDAHRLSGRAGRRPGRAGICAASRSGRGGRHIRSAACAS